MSLITLEDAVELCWEQLYTYSSTFDDMSYDEILDFQEWLRSEFEQKCFINRYSKNESLQKLSDLIFDINPKEIAKHIESDNLRNWCNMMQIEMNLAMVQLPLGEKDV